MSSSLDVFKLTDDDAMKFLVCESHIGTKKMDYQMEHYVWKRRSDAIPAVCSESSADAIQHRDLPPSPRGECDPELAQRFVAFFEKKERGVDMHASIKRRKEYINPALYEALRNAYGIDEKGTCFARAVYDPNAFAADDFYDALGDHQAVLEQRRKKMVQQQQQQEQHQHSSSKRPASFPTGGGKAK